MDVRVRGWDCYQSWTNQQRLLVSDLGNSKFQTTFLRLHPCFLTPTSSSMFAFAPITFSFLQPLMRLLIYSTSFMISLMAMSSWRYHDVPLSDLFCSPLSWLSGLGEQGLFFPSASYHANKYFVRILQILQFLNLRSHWHFSRPSFLPSLVLQVRI